MMMTNGTFRLHMGAIFLRFSTFKPSLNNYEPNDIFLLKAAQPFSRFSETNEQQLIFIHKKDSLIERHLTASSPDVK